MKTFCISTLPIPGFILNSNVDGIALTVKAASLFGINGIGYNGIFMSDLKTVIRNTNKEFVPGVIWGSECGRVIHDHYPTLSFVRKHHNDPDNPEDPIKVPVFYHPGYIQKVIETMTWFITELEKDIEVSKKIPAFKITGDNETSLEMKNTAVDFADVDQTKTPAEVQFEAQWDAAQKWINAGKDLNYMPQAAELANEMLIDAYIEMTGKTLILPYIVGLNGFPAVDKNGVFCKPKLRENTTQKILDYAILASERVKPQTTIFKAGSTTSDKYVQINSIFHEKATLAEFQETLDHAETLGVQYIEVHAKNLTRFPGVFY